MATPLLAQERPAPRPTPATERSASNQQSRATPPAVPGDLTLVSSVVAGGAATVTSADGSLTLGATLGQPTAGSLSGGDYTLGSGFWHTLGEPGDPYIPTDGLFVSPDIQDRGRFGESVAAVPDVDGDGVEDILVGAQGEDVNGLNGAGQAHLYSGATSNLLLSLTSPNAVADGQFGGAVAGVADVNGDGQGDLLVGAPQERGAGGFSTGRAYLFSGADGTLLETIDSPNPSNGGNFGASVASVGDTDGDGRSDLLIGEPGALAGGLNQAGRAYLFSGADGALLFALASPVAELRGRFGESVASVQDTDGDGADDLLVGAYGEGDSGGAGDPGRAHLFSGATGTLLFTLASPNEGLSGSFGKSVAGVADTDGDGTGDLLVGAEYERIDSQNPEGRAYLFSGADGALLHTLVSPLTDAFRFGGVVASVPDADGDGAGDLLASETSGGGRAHLFSGATGAFLETFTSPNASNSGPNPQFATSLAGIGDLDGDGAGDVLVGAPYEDITEDFTTLTDAGRVYAVEGTTPLPPSGTPPLTVARSVPSDLPVAPGEAFSLDIRAGSATDPVADLFGLAFRLTYDAALFDLASVNGLAETGVDCNGDGTSDVIGFSDQSLPGVLAYSFALRGDVCPDGLSGADVFVAAVTFSVRTDAVGGAAEFAFTEVEAIDSAGAPLALDPQTATVVVFDGLLVWPGDTNDDDAAVSTVDLGPIAAFFNVEGPAREADEQGIVWWPKQATPWPDPATPPPYNLAHTDADGDGRIDEADVLAIGLNFGRTPGVPVAPVGAPTPEQDLVASTGSASNPEHRAVRGAGVSKLSAPHRSSSPRSDVSSKKGDASAKGGTPVTTLTIPALAAGEAVDLALSLEATVEDQALGFSALWTVPTPLTVESVEAGAWLDDGNLLALDFFDLETRVFDVGMFRRNGAEVLEGEGVALMLRLVATTATAATELVLDRVRYGTVSGTAPDVPADRVTVANLATTNAEDGTLPTVFTLEANYPNPFASRTTIRYALAEPSAVRLDVYDLLGRRVATLVDEEQAAGRFETPFDASDLASGTYLYRLSAGRFTAVERMAVLR